MIRPSAGRDKRSLPCKTCPWRVDRDASTIPAYDHDKAVGLINTVGDDDAFRPIMACHRSNDREEFACKGYLAREGWSNLGVRLAVIRGRMESPTAVLEACEAAGVELEEDYPSVLEKLARSIESEPGRLS